MGKAANNRALTDHASCFRYCLSYVHREREEKIFLTQLHFFSGAPSSMEGQDPFEQCYLEVLAPAVRDSQAPSDPRNRSHKSTLSVSCLACAKGEPSGMTPGHLIVFFKKASLRLKTSNIGFYYKTQYVPCL